MNNAPQAIAKILVHEGGYVNHPGDPGGPTNKGITLATFRRYIKPSGSIADLKALTEAQAIVVYKRQYWDAVVADMLPAGVDYCVADYAVNSGPSRAAKSLQRAIGVPQDGRVGPKTIEATLKTDSARVVNAICDERLAFMRRARDKDGRLLWSTFGKGWTRRVADVRATSLAWTTTQPRVKDVALTVPGQDQPNVNPVAYLLNLIVAALGFFFARLRK
jgi:lysozyme family protein